MKQKNKQKRRDARLADYEKTVAAMKGNSRGYKRPGSWKK